VSVCTEAGTRAPPTPRPNGIHMSVGPRTLLALILLAGVVLRLMLAPFGGFQYDIQYMAFWAFRLATQPLAAFYATPVLVDHLPGDLWILLLIVHLYRLVSPAMQVQLPLFPFLLKLVPTLADAGVGLMLFLLVRRFAGTSAALLAAAVFLLNPASVFLTAIWGQWDSVSFLVVLIALWALVHGDGEFAFPLLTYAVLIKPNLAVVVPFFAIAFVLDQLLPDARTNMYGRASWNGERLRTALLRLAVAVVTSLAVLLLVLRPFNVGIPLIPARWDLFQRLGYALNYYPNASSGAFNIWSLLSTPLPLAARLDNEILVFGISDRFFGIGMFALAYAGICLAYLCRRSFVSLAWACLAATLASFMLLTRGHERYLFPAVGFAALIAVWSPRLLLAYIGLTCTYLANLYWVYNFYYPVAHVPLLYSSLLLVHVVSALNLLLTLYLLIGGFRELRARIGDPAPEPARGELQPAHNTR
jgi:hypothetical protein